MHVSFWTISLAAGAQMDWIFLLVSAFTLLCLGKDAWVDGLRLSTSPKALYDHVVCNIFELIDYGDNESLLALPRLLAIDEFDFNSFYKSATLTDQQFLALYQQYFISPEIHPTIFPMCLVGRTSFGVNTIRGRLQEYNIREIEIKGDTLFTGHDLRIILAKLGPRPECCASKLVERKALSVGLQGDWRINDDLFLPDRNQYPKSSIFGTIERFLAIDSCDSLLENIFDDFQDLLNHASTVAKLGANWKRSFLRLEQVLQDNIKDMSEARQLLWKGKLLLLFGVKLSEDKRLILFYNTNKLTQFFTTKVTEYFETSNFDMIPLCISKRLLWIFIDFKIFLPKLSKEKMVQLDRLQLVAPSLSRTWEAHILKWRSFLHRERLYDTIPPQLPITLTEAVLWWADYIRLEDVLFIPDRFSSPLRLVQHPNGADCLWEVREFLEILTDHLWKLVAYACDNHLNTLTKVEIKCFTRTLYTNILLTGNIGFPLKSWHLSRLYEQTDLLSTFWDSVFDLAKGSYLESYIPETMMFERTFPITCILNRYNLLLPTKLLILVFVNMIFYLVCMGFSLAKPKIQEILGLRHTD